jgi:DNA-directed RNA polymerase specialized sigma24 family protein
MDQGKRLGRPRAEVDKKAIAKHREKGLSVGEIARKFRVSVQTVKRRMVSQP